MSAYYNKKSHSVLSYILCTVFALILFLWQSSPKLLPEFFSTTPIFILALLASVGVLAGERFGAMLGFFSGLLMDVYASPSICFNLILLTVIGAGCGLTARALRAKSFWSACVLCIFSSMVYYVLYWLVYRVIIGPDTAFYLLRYSLPAVCYTCLTVIPIHFTTKSIFKIKKDDNHAKTN